MNSSNFGLSKKTNIAIAGIMGLTMAKEILQAVIAITMIVVIGLTYQFLIDREKGKVG